MLDRGPTIRVAGAVFPGRLAAALGARHRAGTAYRTLACRGLRPGPALFLVSDGITEENVANLVPDD